MANYPPIKPAPLGDTPDYDRDNGNTGLIAPSSRGWFYSTLTLTASRAYYVRFEPSRAMLIDAIEFVLVTAAGANDNVDVGIYDSTGQTKLASSGATAGKLNAAVPTRQTLTLTTPYTVLPRTAYYAAISPGTFGGTAAVLLASGWGTAWGSRLAGSSFGQVEGDFMNTAHPLPAALTLGGGSGTLMALFLREST